MISQLTTLADGANNEFFAGMTTKEEIVEFGRAMDVNTRFRQGDGRYADGIGACFVRRVGLCVVPITVVTGRRPDQWRH